MLCQAEILPSKPSTAVINYEKIKYNIFLLFKNGSESLSEIIDAHVQKGSMSGVLVFGTFQGFKPTFGMTTFHTFWQSVIPAGT